MKIIYGLIIGLFVLYSCTDESSFPNELEFELENGGFVRFQDLNTFTDVIDFNDFISSYNETRTIEDVNGNLSNVSYDLTATISGDAVFVENAISSSTFPFDINLSQASLASLLGVEASTLLAGDNFTFSAKAERNDGVVFNADPFVFEQDVEVDGVTGDLIRITSTTGSDGSIVLDTAVVLPAGGFNVNLLRGTNYISGNTQPNLETSGYADAMTFTVSIACPFLAEEAVGMYLITNDPFETTLDITSPIEAVLNDTGDGVIFKDLFKHPEMYDVEFIFSDPLLGSVTIERQPAWHCDNFGCSFGEGRVDGAGSFFTCIGLVNVELQHTVDAGSFGTFNLKLQKQ